MNRHDIRLLQAIQGYPTVTITLPTHRTSPDNRQDPIRVKNLVDQVTDRLQSEFSKREVAPLLNRLVKLVGEIDYRYTLDGLALFANKDFARAFQVPFKLRERVVIDPTFMVRDLVFALNRTPRYWVLALSEKPTRLFEGVRETLTEITEGAFPMVHSGPGGERPMPGGFGIQKSALRDEYLRQFFRQVDAEYRSVTADDPLPLALVGVVHQLAAYQKVAASASQVITTITGSHDKTTAHELGKLVWPLVEANLSGQRNQVLQDLDAAISAQAYASGIGEVWRMANAGRGSVLLVEEGFHYPARLDESGHGLLPVAEALGPDTMEDAVDDVIEVVLSKGGRVVFVDDGALQKHQQIALILRY